MHPAELIVKCRAATVFGKMGTSYFSEKVACPHFHASYNTVMIFGWFEDSWATSMS
jgi:hypothetical protein